MEDLIDRLYQADRNIDCFGFADVELHGKEAKYIIRLLEKAERELDYEIYD